MKKLTKVIYCVGVFIYNLIINRQANGSTSTKEWLVLVQIHFISFIECIPHPRLTEDICSILGQ